MTEGGITTHVYSDDEVRMALCTALACVGTVEETADGNRLIAGPSGPLVTDVLAALISALPKEGDNDKGK